MVPGGSEGSTSIEDLEIFSGGNTPSENSIRHREKTVAK